MLTFVLLYMLYGYTADSSPTCPPPESFQYSASLLSLNFDGKNGPDVVAEFSASQGEHEYIRRTLVLDAPKKIIQPGVWLENCVQREVAREFEGSFEKRPLSGNPDLLLLTTEFGDYAQFTYYQFSEGPDVFREAISFSHPNHDGQFTEIYKKKDLKIRIVGDGNLRVNKVDVDIQKIDTELKCSHKGKQVQLTYPWDKKGKIFAEPKRGCVLGSSIEE